MTHRRVALVIIVVLLSRPSAATAAENAQFLFNGKDLSGWTYHVADPNITIEDVWSVKDGVLDCKGEPAGYLITKKDDFENYVLMLEWRWPIKGGNNGVLVHVTKPGELGVWPKCLEVQLEHLNAGDFWVIGTTLEVEKPEGRIEGRRHKKLIDGAEKPLGKWNEMKITCHGDEITVEVNSKLVNHATHLSQTKGAIALQSEGTPIEFRKIRLKSLGK